MEVYLIRTLIFSYFFLIMVNFSVFGQSVFVTNDLTTDQQGQLTKMLNDAISDQGLPSLAVAATKGTQVVWYSAEGYENVEKKEKVNPLMSLYFWASVGKLFTSRMAYAEAESGMLMLDAPIGHGAGSFYYPETAKPMYMKRCMTAAQRDEYDDCAKLQGDPWIFSIFEKNCFDPKNFSANKTDRDSYVWISDKSSTTGDIVWKKTSSTNSETICRVNYQITNTTVPDDKFVTMRNIFSHKSGIQHYSYLNRSSLPPASMLEVSDVLARKNKGLSQMEWAIPYFFPIHPLLARPGSTYEYSSFAYNLAGVVLERSAQKTYPELLKKYSSKFSGTSIQPYYVGIKPEPQLVPYRVVTSYENGVPNNNNVDTSYKMASGGIISNILDAGKFCVAGTNAFFFTKAGIGLSHSGGVEAGGKTLLKSKTNLRGIPQCLVLMTNGRNSKVDLESVRAKLEAKLIEMKVWGE